MSPKPDVSEERTAQIIDAAMSVFARKGLGPSRMDDIASESGLSKGTLYLYFKSKDALISAILKAVLVRELERSRQLLESERPFPEKLYQFTEIMVKDFQKMQPLMPIYFEFMALATRRKTVMRMLRGVFEEFLDILVPLIEEGIAAGELRSQDPKEAALAISALFEGTILIWIYAPDLVDLRDHLHTSIDLLMAGMQSKAPA